MSETHIHTHANFFPQPPPLPLLSACPLLQTLHVVILHRNRHRSDGTHPQQFDDTLPHLARPACSRFLAHVREKVCLTSVFLLCRAVWCAMLYFRSPNHTHPHPHILTSTLTHTHTLSLPFCVFVHLFCLDFPFNLHLPSASSVEKHQESDWRVDCRMAGAQC